VEEMKNFIIAITGDWISYGNDTLRGGDDFRILFLQRLREIPFEIINLMHCGKANCLTLK
jgi:hypothetical protein